MTKHVISIHDKWFHEESASCPCDPEVVVNKEGDIVYVHSDLMMKNGELPRELLLQETPLEQKENKSEELEKINEEFEGLKKLHNDFLCDAITKPTMYDAKVIKNINHGIFVRMDYLLKRRYFIESSGKVQL